MAEHPKDMLTGIPYELRFGIASCLDNVEDLGRLSVVNRTFHTMWKEKHERLVTNILEMTAPYATVLMARAKADVVTKRRGRKTSRKNKPSQAHIWIPEMLMHLHIVDSIIDMAEIDQPDDKILFAQVYALQWQLGAISVSNVHEFDRKLRSLPCREMHALATIGALEDDVHELVRDSIPSCPRWPEMPNDWGTARLLADFYVDVWAFETGLGSQPLCVHLKKSLQYKTAMIKSVVPFRTRSVAWSGTHPHKIVRAVGERCSSCDHCGSKIPNPNYWN